MSRALQLIIAIVIGLATSAAFDRASGEPFRWATALAFTLATALSVLVSWLPWPIRGVRLPAKQDAARAGDRELGKVKWFNVAKGFGFIIRADGEEIFVHQRQLTNSARRGLQPGQSVSYRVADSERGPQAEQVELVGGHGDAGPPTARGPAHRRRRS